MKLVRWVFLVLFFAIAMASLVMGNPIASFVQVFPAAVYLLKMKYPNNRILYEISLPRSPVPEDGMRVSEYSAKMAYYSSKWLAVFVFIWSLAVTFRIDIDNNIFALTVFALAIPLFSGMAILATVFHTLKYFYIKVTGRDGIWQREK